MGAGAYVGRVGGLAIALGVGAAVLAGAGVASAADEGSASGSTTGGSSVSTSQAASDGASAGQKTGPEQKSGSEEKSGSAGKNESDGKAESSDDKAESDGKAESSDGKADSEEKSGSDGKADSEEKSGSGDKPDDATQTSGTDGKTATDTDKDSGGGNDAPNAKPDTKAQPEKSATAPVTAATETTATDTEVADQDADTTAQEEPTPAKPAEAEKVSEPEKSAGTTTEPAASTQTVTTETPAPVETETAAVADAAVSTQKDTQDEPTIPALASLVMSLVTAGRSVSEDSEHQAAAATTTTTSLTASADADTPPYPYPINVKVTDVVAPLEFLQHIPILGQYLITPIVRLIHGVPFVGEILHPFIGWPVDHDAPPGTPQPRTVMVTSFDGTSIYVNFMPAKGLKEGQTAPTVLEGPGLGIPGATTYEVTADALLPFDVVGVGGLRDAGYNVVTWDPRGEWHSGGVMYLDSPQLEGRDVSAIISWLSTLKEVQLDGDNDPRIGMVGASYGGGIQLATAAIDHRIDAIVPTIAWNNLVDVLFPRGAVNSAWGTLLPTVLALTNQRPLDRIYPVAIQGVLFGIADQADIDLVKSYGFQDQIKDITAPTLLIQGTVDTLFTLDQADINARQLIEAGTTTKVIWYCGGHGACLSDYNDGKVVIDRTMDWLAKYLKNENVDTGAQFEYVDQKGTWFSSPTYPAREDMTPILAESDTRTTLNYIPGLFGSGPNPLILNRGPIGALLGLPSAAWAINAATMQVPAATEVTHVVGAPELTLTYSGTGTAKHVYAQLVDNTTGLVLGSQATPIPVQLDGQTHTVTYSLEQVAQTLQPGQSVSLQIVTSTAKYLNFYSWGSITVEGMAIRLPTLDDTKIAQEPVTAA